MTKPTFIGLFLFLTGCVTVPAENNSPPLKTNMEASKKLPSVKGTLVVSSTPTNSNQIELTIKHLPKAKAYIVWELPTGARMAPQSLGALNIEKDMTAKLKTVTPFRSFSLFVTAEPSPNQRTPSGEKLLWATVNR